MRVVFWGGPWHDRAVAVPRDRWDVLVIPDPPAAATRRRPRDIAPFGARPEPVRYHRERMSGAGDSIPRRRGAGPTWDVFVIDNATTAERDRFIRAAGRPVVDGPRDDRRERERARSERIAREARVARRGPLP